MKKKIIRIYHRILNIIKLYLIGPISLFFFIRLGFSTKYRVLDINSSAIGHLCLDVECFLIEQITSQHQFQAILLASQTSVANRVLSELWGANSGIVVIENPIACFFLDYLRTCSDTNIDCSRYSATHGKPAEVHRILNKHKYASMIFWKNELLAEAEFLFNDLFPGIDKKRVVVMHVRDTFYDEIRFNDNLNTQNHRNSDVSSYSMILDYLKHEGYTTIRIGDYRRGSSSGNYLELLGVDQYKKELMNIYLASICSVFLGSQSGPICLAHIWRRPIFAINMVPYAELRLFSEESMSIPKLLSIRGRVLSANEIFDRNFHLLGQDSEYEKNEIEVLLNEPLDCLEDFKEFFNAFVLGNQEIKSSILHSRQQNQYKALCPTDTFDHHASGLIARHFFDRHHLIQ